MAEWEQFELVPVDGDGGGRPMAFVGRLLASESTRQVNGPNRNRWIEWRVFETKGGKVVVRLDYATHWEGEQSYSRVAVFDQLDAVPERPDYDSDPCHGLDVWITEPVRVEAQRILGCDVARRIQ
jgi:hypothetical protein